MTNHCPHGQLARVCEVCEMSEIQIALQAEIEALRAEVKTLTLERDRAQDREREYLTQLAAEREKGERLRALLDQWYSNHLFGMKPDSYLLDDTSTLLGVATNDQ